MRTPAILALADGSLFYGTAIGADGETSGEVVFNTAMTGYQEILTDPSYARQMVTLTYPHIGNTGVNEEDVESDRIHAAGLIIRDLPLLASNWRSTNTLDQYLRNNNVVGIADIDTRRLTRILRDKGSQNGAIVAGADATPERALELAKAFPGLKGMDLAKEVTADKSWQWSQTEWDLSSGYGERTESRFKVVAWDYGVKLNILRMLAARGCDITVVPATTPAADVLAMNPDGIFLSNGPGDPEPCDYAIQAIREVLETETPVFGICLGHQLLALASGAKTLKMGHGHHGANHPVQDLASGTVMITSQNHGFAVDEASLPANIEATHKSLFDGTLQGIRRTDKPAYSFQGHPEASPGPHDVAPLFDEFIRLMDAAQG
ncbi:MAG: glutamine-hydrolyzing carbamoyl-phosphate synthase small subunit [Pseudomonadales bacterium]|uniref:glutamine-hydrolyzing carbamoyl-phosphate synthase small subunit n=1 Tax=Marinobacter xestospongiae TaxID=994319 RepID=UPI0020034D7C|nr:glutamine-hydrolyzing carbamoyl-phosphate synthase small subunit [Marinobacter xestospongiae]MCG8519813.1 glutamine-hydrolyzing carbamoyl-phosphate synthase small subunit [Pseudomonadales bacterium]MCK7569065.1 glutamine-hydrolyzing carbamoyl-phosphate synthase small subunit [Marinobacter xestospongiae]